MSTDARIRIESHRLMRTAAPDAAVRVSVPNVAREEAARKQAERQAFMQRTLVHLGLFVVSFVFTAGVALLGILLWVRPDTLLPLVLVGLFCAAIFVAVFASLRMLLVHRLMDRYPNKEDDPGTNYHVGKSVAYGFVALAVALLLVGLLMNVASAFA